MINILYYVLNSRNIYNKAYLNKNKYYANPYEPTCIMQLSKEKEI